MSIPFQLSTPAEIKTVMLAELQESMGDLAEDLLPELALMLLEDAPKMFAELEQAINEGAARELKELAHTFKGSCASMGIKRLAQICQEIENLGRQGELAEAKTWLESAHAEYAQVKLVLVDYQ